MTRRILTLVSALGLTMAASGAAQVIGPETQVRYNAAYRAVPQRVFGLRPPKATIPLPLGVVQLLRDSTVWDTDQPYFNPISVINYILHPPLYLEIKKAPTPTNDVEFFIGQNELIVDLGEAQALVPDNFEIGGSARLFSFGVNVGPVSVGAMSWVHNDIGVALDNNLRGFLKDAVPAANNTTYGLEFDGIFQTGIAPQIGYAGRVWGDSSSGIYLGATARYYYGLGYTQSRDSLSFTTGDTLFAGSNPVTEAFKGTVAIATPFDGAGSGVGFDLGAVWVKGPLEIGFAINDIGAKITWGNTDIDSLRWDATNDQLIDSTLAENVTTTTELPVTTLATVLYGVGESTLLRGGVLINQRGPIYSAGVEQAIGMFRLRGGLVRDQRKMLQYAWGGGVRFGPVGLDLGFFTHSRSISEERGITMTTALLIF